MKSKVSELESTVSQLRVENQRWEAEVTKQQKRLELFLDPSTGIGSKRLNNVDDARREMEKSLLVRQLKTQIMVLRSTVTERDNEIANMNRSLKTTKLVELSNEKEEYYLEVMRLKQIVKELRETIQYERQNRMTDKKRISNSDLMNKTTTTATTPSNLNTTRPMSAHLTRSNQMMIGEERKRPQSSTKDKRRGRDHESRDFSDPIRLDAASSKVMTSN